MFVEWVVKTHLELRYLRFDEIDLVQITPLFAWFAAPRGSNRIQCKLPIGKDDKEIKASKKILWILIQELG